MVIYCLPKNAATVHITPMTKLTHEWVSEQAKITRFAPPKNALSTLRNMSALLWEDRRSPNRSVPLRFPMRVLLCPSCNLCSWFPSLHLNPQIRRCQFSGFARIRRRSAFEVCLRSMRATTLLPSRMIARMRLRLALVYAMGSPPFDDEQSHDYAEQEA